MLSARRARRSERTDADARSEHQECKCVLCAGTLQVAARDACRLCISFSPRGDYVVTGLYNNIIKIQCIDLCSFVVVFHP